jgi:Bacterial Ig-like domain
VPANGPFISSGYATTNQPTFSGTAAAYSIVQLFAQPLNVDAQLSLGETVADSSGNWSLATNPLDTGGYIITAKVTPPGDYPSQVMALTKNNGTFFINLSPATSVAPEASRQIQRPRTRHVKSERMPKPSRTRVARSEPGDGLLRSSHEKKNG